MSLVANVVLRDSLGEVNVTISKVEEVKKISFPNATGKLGFST
jgi:hypothetical protein